MTGTIVLRYTHTSPYNAKDHMTAMSKGRQYQPVSVPMCRLCYKGLGGVVSHVNRNLMGFVARHFNTSRQSQTGSEGGISVARNNHGGLLLDIPEPLTRHHNFGKLEDFLCSFAKTTTPEVG